MVLVFWARDQTTASTTPGDPDASTEAVTDASTKDTEAEAPTQLVAPQELVDTPLDAVVNHANKNTSTNQQATSNHVDVVVKNNASTELVTIKLNPVYNSLQIIISP